MSRTAFSAHMILHLGVVALAAPLLAIGLIHMGLKLDGVRSLRGWTVIALMAELIVVWGWHAPFLHEAAARHVGVFVLQQVSFLAVGLAVWLLGFAVRAKAAVGVAMIGFVLTLMHMTMLGMLLIFAPRLLYPAELCLGAFGFEALDDQRFGGMLMVGWSGIAYLAGAIALGRRLLAEESTPAMRKAFGENG
jgi:putative membrane protein